LIGNRVLTDNARIITSGGSTGIPHARYKNGLFQPYATNGCGKKLTRHENVTSISETQKPYCECSSHDAADNACLIISPALHTEMKALQVDKIKIHTPVNM
jgi:hypothetical protein